MNVTVVGTWSVVSHARAGSCRQSSAASGLRGGSLVAGGGRHWEPTARAGAFDYASARRAMHRVTFRAFLP